MRMPEPRGALSEHVVSTLGQAPGRQALEVVEPTDVEDEQLGLFLLQQLSYRPVHGVDAGWEDDVSFLVLRERLEQTYEDRLRAELRVPDCEPARVPQALVDMLDGAGGPSLSGWMDENGTLDHLREFVIHRSAYQLQEADPHSFALPRLAAGKVKTALLELQMDEYGGHEPTEAHAALFAETMRAMDLDPDDGPDIDRLPAVTLATNTLLDRLGRSRRLVGGLIGHLAVFEMTSVGPMAHYASACRRLLDDDAGTQAARFFDVHVAADGLHAKVAMERLVDGLAEQFPDDAPGILFGAAALIHVEGAFTDHILTCWHRREQPRQRQCTGGRHSRAGCRAPNSPSMPWSAMIRTSRASSARTEGSSTSITDFRCGPRARGRERRRSASSQTSASAQGPGLSSIRTFRKSSAVKCSRKVAPLPSHCGTRMACGPHPVWNASPP